MSSLEMAVVIPVYNEPQIEDTLAALYNQNYRSDVMHFVIDNASTDDTRARIDRFQQKYDDFPVTVVEEREKGTGAACDTGFRAAIERGFNIIARTDGDTLPKSDWTHRISDNFAHKPFLQLLGGTSLPLRDKHHRIGDNIAVQAGMYLTLGLKAMRNRSTDLFRVGVGHNMATTSTAYVRVGGIERTSIAEADEDVEYSLKVVKQFGRKAFYRDREMQVYTSMRRVREYGSFGILKYYALPEQRRSLAPSIDVR